MAATVHYAFHPLRGLELTVVRRSREIDGVAHLVAPDGYAILVPEWMLRPESAEIGFGDAPEIASGACIRAAELVRLAQRGPEDGAGGDSAGAGSYRGGKPRRRRWDKGLSTSSSSPVKSDQEGKPDGTAPAKTESCD